MRGLTRVKCKESEKHPCRGNPKSQEKAEERIDLGKPLTNMLKSIEISV